MINNCFTRKLDSSLTNGSEEYLYGQKFVFNNWVDGSLVFEINKEVDPTDIIVDHLSGGSHSFSYVYNSGHTLRLTGNNFSGYFLIKDTSDIVIYTAFLASYATAPYRRASWTTGMYANYKTSAAAALTHTISAQGAVVSGDIQDFSKFISITDLRLQDSKITGNLESLGNGLLAFGKTSGSLEVTCNGKITVSDVAVANGDAMTITFSGSGYTIESAS